LLVERLAKNMNGRRSGRIEGESHGRCLR